MTEPAFDEVIHAPQRLRIMALLAAVAGRVEFTTVRDVLDVADSVLSKHLKVLRDAGYLELRKPTGLGRVRTWIQLTPRGGAAFTSHVAALREIVSNPGAESQASAPGRPL